MPVIEFRTSLDLAPLSGATVSAYAMADGYWHLYVALRLTDGHVWLFATEGHWAGPRFEVFPVTVRPEEGVTRDWIDLPHPFTVKNARPLWRNEWIEPGAAGESLGTGTATHCAGPGPVSEEAVAVVRVLAGVLLEADDGERMVIAASDSAPLNVDLFLPGQAALALEGFEPAGETEAAG